MNNCARPPRSAAAGEAADQGIPGWRFTVQERSAGVYEVEGLDSDDRRVYRQGADPDAILEAAVADARAIMASVNR